MAITEGNISVISAGEPKNVIYVGILYDTMYLPVSPISTSCHKYAGPINDCLYEKYKNVLHFS